MVFSKLNFKLRHHSHSYNSNGFFVLVSMVYFPSNFVLFLKITNYSYISFSEDRPLIFTTYLFWSRIIHIVFAQPMRNASRYKFFNERLYPILNFFILIKSSIDLFVSIIHSFKLSEMLIIRLNE